MTVVLTIAAGWAGAGLVTPGCYMEGRRAAEAHGLQTIAYSSEAAWVQIVSASAAAIWLVLYAVQLGRMPTLRCRIVHALLPVASLAYWTWWASGNAMPCAS